MKAVILAAGLGKRMGGIPKPLLKVGGLEIILRTMKLLQPHVDEFIIVASVHFNKIDGFLKKYDFNYKIVYNKYPEKGNGYSLLLASEFVNGKFVVVMGDHVYSREFINEAIKKVGLIGDKNPKFVDIQESTKVKVREGKVADIGKELEIYDCVDTGFFVMDSNIFSKLNGLSELEFISISDIAKCLQIPVSYVNGKFWLDIDTKDDLKRGNLLLIKNSVKIVGDGFISRILNRKISTRISALTANWANPSHFTFLSFFVGILASILLFLDIRIAAIFYQISSIIDGCDGEIARAKMLESKFGGYLDSILDRFVDFTFLAFLTILYPKYLTLALFAIFGSLMVSYSTEKYKAEYSRSAYEDIISLRYLPGKRDERIFLIMILCLVGTIKLLFLLLSILCIGRVIVTLFLVYKKY